MMKSITICYGSQTGTSQDYSEKVYFQLLLLGNSVDISLIELDQLNLENNESFLIIICATTGQGDPPTNMKLFWKKIMNKNHERIKNQFCIFGLGDSSYSQYNFIAKKLYRRLIQLGGYSAISFSLGDEQNTNGIDESFTPWNRNLLKYITSTLNLDDIYVEHNLSLMKIMKCESVNVPSYTQLDIRNDLNYLTVTSNELLTPDSHFQETRLIKFQKSVSYELGDVLVIYPSNSLSDIDMFFNLTNLNKNDILRISKFNQYFSLPKIMKNDICSVSDLVKYVFDLNTVPRKSFFEKFALASNDNFERDRLNELVENLDELYEYCFTPKRSVVEVMRDFPNTSKCIQMEQWINIIPFIRPREYSIASSCITHDEIEILVARVKYQTKINQPRKGLCSSYLCNLIIGENVIAHVQKGTLDFKRIDSNVLLISTGTGISALRGFIHENFDKLNLFLFFGCRYKTKDFYFQSEYEEFGVEKFSLVTAFSREEKVYIQEKIKGMGEKIFDLIVHKNCSVFLTGRAIDMPSEVFDAFVDILQDYGQFSKEDSKQYLLRMQKIKRYQLETWS